MYPGSMAKIFNFPQGTWMMAFFVRNLIRWNADSAKMTTDVTRLAPEPNLECKMNVCENSVNGENFSTF